MGTNTLIQGQVIDSIKTGTKVRVEWMVPNVFSNGSYYVDLAIVYRGGSSTSDWWEEAAKFITQKEQSTQYTVTPDIEVKLLVEKLK